MTQRIVEVHVGVPGNTPLIAWAEVGHQAPGINSWKHVDIVRNGQSHDHSAFEHPVKGKLCHIGTGTGEPDDLGSLIDQAMTTAHYLPGSRVDVEIVHPLQEHWNFDVLAEQMDAVNGRAQGLERRAVPPFETHLRVVGNGRTSTQLLEAIDAVLDPEDYFKVTTFQGRETADKAIITIAGDSANIVGRDSRTFASMLLRAGEATTRGPLEQVIACWTPASLSL